MASAVMAPIAQPDSLQSIPLPTAPDSLSVKINTATRQIHAELNRHITARIPLALPPYTDNPDLYLHGIHAFAQLYFAFEEAWQDLICDHLASAGDDRDLHANRVRAYIAQLVEPRLWRTQRLEADIAHLRKARGVVLPDLSADPLIAGIRARIAAAVPDKTHILLAYSWVLYLAIFSGGRWIRAQLAAADGNFWCRDDPSDPDAHEGLSLFHFDSPCDGEDIRATFKARFVEADTILSEADARDVCHEANTIFADCLKLVRALDGRLAADPSAHTTPATTHQPPTRRALPSKPARTAGREKQKSAGVAANYLTEGLSPLAAAFAILLGFAVWYFLYSAGLRGGNFGSIIGAD